MAVKNDKERKPFGMPTFEEFYRFLKSYYLHSRFEARNTEGWGPDYSHCVAKSHYEALERDGVGLISMYESRTATVVKYNQQLEIINPDEPLGQIQKKAGRLTSILGSSSNF